MRLARLTGYVPAKVLHWWQEELMRVWAAEHDPEDRSQPSMGILFERIAKLDLKLDKASLKKYKSK